jgi:hypothetical protein
MLGMPSAGAGEKCGLQRGRGRKRGEGELAEPVAHAARDVLVSGVIGNIWSARLGTDNLTSVMQPARSAAGTQ